MAPKNDTLADPVGVRLPKGHKDKLDVLCERKERSFAYMLRKAVELLLKAEGLLEGEPS